MSTIRPAGGGRARPPRPVTPQYLENAALHYLQRFASSSGNLRRVLMRKVHRSAELHGTDPAEAARRVDEVLARLNRQGWLDDRAYAEMIAGSLHRRGTPMRAIRGRLAAKAVDPDTIATAIDGLDAGTHGPTDLVAAIHYARRRRLGPFRTRGQPAERRDKDLAAMARAGFDLDTARAIIDAESVEELRVRAESEGADRDIQGR